MADILLYLIIGIFISLLFLNLYFRIKVFGLYKILVRERIEFGARHFFNQERMEHEVLRRYPGFRNEIIQFTSQIKFSIFIAVLLVMLITIAGSILKQL
jgi:hypothetical protein